MNTWKWVMRNDFTWELVLHLGRNATLESGSSSICNEAAPELLPVSGSSSICNEAASELLSDTEYEMVPEYVWDTEYERMPETEDERTPETEDERVPETEVDLVAEIEAELVPAEAVAPSASVAEPPVLEEETVWRSEAERILYYKCFAIFYPQVLSLI